MPPPLMSRAVRAWRRVTGDRDVSHPPDYERLYESLARRLPPDLSIGGGDFEEIGKLELAFLVHAGLRPESSLLDFGCGTGRLAGPAVRFLTAGEYTGTDISPTMLAHAQRSVGNRKHVRLVHQTGYAFPSTDRPYDLIAAFSVFTHMEPEDCWRYLRSALDVTHADSVFVASVIPLTSPLGVEVFTAAASVEVRHRWMDVRNFVTSRDFFGDIAQLAGWEVVEWLEDGVLPSNSDEPDSRAPDPLGQSVVVMRRSAS